LVILKLNRNKIPMEKIFVQTKNEKIKLECKFSHNVDSENDLCLILVHPYGKLGGSFDDQ
jgi:hypothetical protein